MDECLPARAVGGSRLQCCGARSKDLQWGGGPFETADSTRSRQSCREKIATTMRALLRRGFNGAGALRIASFIFLMAILRSATNMPTKWTGWTGLFRYTSERLRLEEPLSWPATSMSFRAMPTRVIRPTGSLTPCSCHARAKNFAPCAISD